MKSDRAFLLSEIEDIIRTMPPRATIRHPDREENVNWFGRVSAAIETWNPSKSALAQQHIELFFSNRHAREAAQGLTSLLTLLNQARTELQWQAGGDVRTGTDMHKKIFIGHGRSLVWHQLKSFLNDRLHLACDEFNAEAVAGISTTARLQALLDNACFAFLVMTAEDVHADTTAHARENVIHEAGLFQGRLGFERAIILLEEGCAQFSNIHGLTHIGFPKGNLEPAFEKIRQVLEREDALHGEATRPVAARELAAAVTGERCPKCFQNGWHIESSAPDDTFGVLGVAKRTYKCHLCGFTESKLSE
jgi:predicted nucleotide-binding protein